MPTQLRRAAWPSSVVLVAIATALLSTPVRAAPPFRVIGTSVERNANAVVALIGYSVVPDVTTSSLSISNGSTGNPGLWSTQLGGGATISDTTPLYLEGVAAYTRYDPTFVATDGSDDRFLPLRWNTVNVSGGIGWDFPVSEYIKIRPIFNIALGKVVSDLYAGQWIVNHRTDRDIQFLDGGTLNAYGLGGSLMMVYEDFKPEREQEVELRYSNIVLQSFDSDTAVQGRAVAQSLGVWARYRAPTGFTALDRPIRYVLEFAHTEYLGQLRGALGFDYLTSLGAGFELDSSKYDIIVTRTRLVARYVFGNNVSGVSVGLAVSF
ncbi:autotransporter domain-containing protein [Silvimonas amylolytica]|uniref:autotransporter domain-containing protein n=1 Tax=Silvimonas amylolytica TaxID=449663 RepID=UPI00166C90A5|nr:autotransporter domain-containing protein [Silvimonas amylolytica]